ncbi:MAG: hypothetical protein JWM53_1565 [bacterium]|nr:hypothetical protein [bacterium]
MTVFVVGFVALAACASTQKLSASTYAHEERAATLAARGQHDAAAEQQRAADAEREKLARRERAWVSVNPW